MDPFEALKLQTAMKNHKLKSHRHLLYGFIPHLLTALTCSLLCSYTFWLPSIDHFLFVTLPHVRTSLLSPNCLFLVVNAIIAFLLGESKLGGRYSSATSRDEIYEEYVERSRTRKVLSTCLESKSPGEPEREKSTGDEAREEEEESEKESGDDNDDKKEAEQEQQEDDDEEESEKESGDDNDDKQEAEQEQQEDDDDDDDDEEEKDERIVQEEDGIPAEELKKRVEEFIARVNRQRWLEARSLMCAR